ncbi:MAG: thioesterase [Acidobacteriota bacterium]|nr:thioesterase [Acidobacteriota bacterium]MDW3228739.1 thioesterase [Acidobacteriota bacterium]MDY0231626.1 thioesterase [Candidatus Saccharicenans sp.]
MVKESPALFDCSYEVLSFDTDYQGRAHLSALMNYLQDAARQHSIRDHFSVFELFDKGLTWVVSRYHLKIDRYPELGEKIQVKTWASGKFGYYALRDFEIYDTSQKQLAVATSSWMIIELNSRRPVKVENLFPDSLILPARILDDDFAVLPIVERLDYKTSFRVCFEDLDFNRHVNNVVYSRWAVEGMPQEVLFSSRVYELEVNYRSEAFFGDEIEIISQCPSSPEDFWVQQVFNLSTGKELARLRSLWKYNEPDGRH